MAWLMWLGICWTSCRWLMLFGPHIHPKELSDLSRTRHTTLATLELGHTCCHISPRGFWGSLGMYMGFLCYHPPSSIWEVQWGIGQLGTTFGALSVRLCHMAMGFHGPTLWSTCLCITSIRFHMWFRQRKERHRVVMYVFCHNLNLNHNS